MSESVDLRHVVPASGRGPAQSAAGDFGDGFESDPYEPAGHERHLRDYVKILYKRRWLVLSTFLVVFLGATINAFTTTPLYDATAKLLIETVEPN